MTEKGYFYKNRRLLGMGMLLLALLWLLAGSKADGAATSDTWEAKADVSWYNTNSSSFDIDSPEELAGLAAIVNGTAKNVEADNFEGKTINLTADIDLGGKKGQDGTWSGTVWVPVGKDENHSFKGVFNGNGKAIKNLYINHTESEDNTKNEDPQGLFGYTGGFAVIKNMDITSGYVYNGVKSRWAASVVGDAGENTVLINCKNKADILAEGTAGGIVAHTEENTQVWNCCNFGNVSAQRSIAGGIVGNSGGDIHNSYNAGKVYGGNSSSSGSVGGILGYTNTVSKIQGCYNIGDVQADGTGAKVGAIAGNASTGSYNTKKESTFKDCVYVAKDGLNGVGSDSSQWEGITGGSAEELKAMTLSPGEAYIEDTDNTNDGYPILRWQQRDEKGNYILEEELENLDIEDVTVTNGSVLLTMNCRLEYTPVAWPELSINATVQREGEEQEQIILPIATITQNDNEEHDKTIVTLTFEALQEKDKINTLSVQVSYRGQTAKTGSYDIPVSDNWIDYAAESFAGGDGSYDSPYEIATAEQLALLSAQAQDGEKYSDKYFVLTADIDLGKTVINGVEALWTPIKSFRGSIDGQNHTIKNMTVDVEGESDCAGLFGELDGRVINLNMEEVSVKCIGTGDAMGSAAGALAGRFMNSYLVNTNGGEIRNVHVLSGTVEGETYVGGLVGEFIGSREDYMTSPQYDIYGCSSAADVKGTGTVGGLVGSAQSRGKSMQSPFCDDGRIQISNCYATGTVTMNNNGLTGYAGSLTGGASMIGYARINHCYASGTVNVTGSRGAAGLIGVPSWANSAYAPGDVVVENNVSLTTEITGTMVSGYKAGRIGGLLNKDADSLEATYRNNYALDSMTLFGETVSTEDALQGTSKTAEELAKQSTWEELGFDFSENGAWTWDDQENRPILTGELQSYGIYIKTQPKDAVCYGDKAAVYETEAVFGVGELTYTWQSRGKDDADWQDITEANGENGKKRIKISAGTEWNDSQIRCRITDEAGTAVYTTTASLTVREENLTAKMAAEQLYEWYEANGISTIRAPFAVYDAVGSLDSLDVALTWQDDYASLYYDGGEQAWAVLDYIARGKNPLNFVKDGADEKNPETVNIINELLEKQNANNTGAFFSEDDYRTQWITSNVYYTLALDIFHGGATWGNEDASASHGRAAAINYLLGLLREDNASGGKVFLSKKTVAVKPDGTGGYAVENAERKALAANADFAILMARLSDDAEFGERAKSAMKDVLTMLTYEYGQGTFDAHTEAMAHYLSALVAASNVADKDTYLEQADKVYHQLLDAAAFDGTYAASTVNASLQESGDEDATAAVLMAFADYAKGSCLLAELDYESNTEELIEADMNAITIPSTVTGNLNLPVKGSNGTEFVWTSSKENVIAADGTVNRQSKDTTVVLTVKATLNGVTVEKSYKVIMAKQQVEGGDDVAAAIEKLSLLPEYITDIDLPDTGANDTSISWSSSDPGIISSSGKVTRPAVGNKDAVVTLTATVSKGKASDTKTFDVKVWAQVDTDTTEGLIKESYYQVRKNVMNTTVLRGYWQVWVAYAALGEQITDFDFTYDATGNSASQTGAHVLALVALGENPYDYRGVNYVQRMLNKGMSAGGWSVPIFNMLGAEAAGVKNVSMPLDTVSGWLTGLSMGPDLGGWACVPISRHVDDSAEYRAKLNTFLNAVKTDMAYNLDTSSGGSPILSKGCVVTGLSALYASGVKVNLEGIRGLNPAFDEPWKSFGAVDEICKTILKSADSGSFGSQLQMEICDLYNVLYNNRNVGWIQCGVSKAKLQEQIAKARDILAEKDSYSESIISDIETALKAAENISGERLNQEIADYGEEYYALYDAVRAAEGKKMNYPEEENPDDGSSTGGSQIGGAVDGGSNVGQQQPGAQQSGSPIVNSGNAAETPVKLAKAAWRTPQLKSRTIKLRWKKVKKADGYEIYMRKSKKGKYKRIKNIKNVKKLTYVKKGLKKGKTYYFRIRAYKKVGGQKVYGKFSRTLRVRCR